MDNLLKSGKLFPPGPRRDSMPLMSPRGFPLAEAHGKLPSRASDRRPSSIGSYPRAAIEGIDYAVLDPRMVTPPVPRHYSVPEFDGVRSPSAAGLQSFYATQRYQPRGPVQEPETLVQAKRRAAAQRERELRNYHQEQQYNRSMASRSTPLKDPAYLGSLAVLADVNPYGKDRVVSPEALSEDDRRDLIARQHRALYSAHSEGAHSEDGQHPDDNGAPRNNLNIHSNGASAPNSNAGGTRGPSPMSFDPFGQNGSVNGSKLEGNPPLKTPSSEHPPHLSGSQSTGTLSPQHHVRSNSGGPSVYPQFGAPSNPASSFPVGVHPQHAALTSRTTASSPGGSPPRSAHGQPPQQLSRPGSSQVAPIGTRPAQAQNPALNNAKRATTPLASPLSFGFAASEQDPFNSQLPQQQSVQQGQNGLPKALERSASAASEQHPSQQSGQSQGQQGQNGDGLGWSKVWGPGNKGMGNTHVASVWG